MLWDQENGLSVVVTKAGQLKVERTGALDYVNTQVRLKRVQELRLAIAEGTYTVPVEQIADSLLRLANTQSRLQGGMYP